MARTTVLTIPGPRSTWYGPHKHDFTHRVSMHQHLWLQSQELRSNEVWRTWINCTKFSINSWHSRLALVINFRVAWCHRLVKHFVICMKIKIQGFLSFIMFIYRLKKGYNFHCLAYMKVKRKKLLNITVITQNIHYHNSHYINV